MLQTTYITYNFGFATSDAMDFRIFTQSFFYMLIYVIFSRLSATNSKHLKGVFKTDNFYKFLAKFGIQKTNSDDVIDTEGFIYGNITSNNNISSLATMVVVDSDFFMEFYGNSTLKLHDETCNKMFRKIDSIAYDSTCLTKGVEDFLRRIPCPKTKLCVDEDNPKNVLRGHQFTFRVQNFHNPRFWYISLVSCQRNLTNHNCSWMRTDKTSVSIEYDIWFVNGDPASKHLNPFEHQFSFEDHDTFECYFTFLVCYIIVLLIWIYAYKKQKHAITKLFTFTLCLEVFGIMLNFLHVIVYSVDGVGVFVLNLIGNAVDTVSQCFFMLFLLLIARGWTITHMEIKGKMVVFSIWGVYLLLNCVLYAWNLTEIDVISNIDEWQTWPGYLTLGFRIFIMVWFVVELRLTVQNSKYLDRLRFLQQFGAFFLVWYIYLPVLAAISTQISALWKHKTILSITNAADLLSFLVMIHLLWPSRSILYLIKSENPLPTFELEITGLLDDQEEIDIFSKKRKTVEEPNHNTIPNGVASPNKHSPLQLDDVLADEDKL